MASNPEINFFAGSGTLDSSLSVDFAYQWVPDAIYAVDNVIPSCIYRNRSIINTLFCTLRPIP